MTAALYRLGGLCVRHRWIVLLLWLAVFAGLAGWARSAGTNVNDNLTLPGSGSQRATDVLSKHFASQANGVNPVVLQAPAGAKLSDSRFAQPVADTVKALKDDAAVRGATSPLSKQGKPLLDKDGTIGYIALRLRLSPTQLTLDDANRLVGEARPARAAGLAVAYGGYLGQKVSKPETHSSEAVGLSMAVLVLLFTFGTAVAMALPIATALLGLVCGLSIVTLLSHVADVPTVAPTLATMIGLGVGIDYALFVVTRHQAQRRAGMDTRESIARAVASSGGAILFAGGTVIIALLSLAVVGIPLVTTLGYTSALVVAVAVTAAITLLPALLAAIGERIDRLALPHHDHTADDHPHGWARWGEAVAKRPWQALVGAVVVLALLAVPVLDLTLGQQDNGALPTDTNSRRAYDALTTGFGVGANGPLLVSVDLSRKPAKADQSQLKKLDSSESSDKAKANQQFDAKQTQAAQSLELQGVPPAQASQQAAAQVKPKRDAKLKQISQSYDAKRTQLDQLATDPRLQTLRDDVAKTPGVASVTQPLVNGKGTAAVLTVNPTTAPSDHATEELVRRLRDQTVPKATKGTDMSAAIGGTTAGYVDLADEIASRLVLTIAVVVALSFVLLLVAFRSIVIPLTAGLMNLVSIGAAFGVVTAVFEKGWGSGLIGLDGAVPIVSYVPLMMFAILFGLSMDYEVFLMTHIREAWLRLGDNRAAVIAGVANTGRVITSAALIMVSVFFAFVINGDPTVKQFGVGMGVAVAVDATLVRCLLVPAVMIVIGRANWWFPRWLEWVPNLSIEGEDWFAERDHAAAERETEPVVHA
ncbi:MAG: putative drug exporter of the superfamily [Solirubrobacteraceae bacterium]|jgi:RND superfamily putative drug exporter|nr:putative drug exporter of the superfamily [Solirubrobacteraceae bacterium]